MFNLSIVSDGRVTPPSIKGFDINTNGVYERTDIEDCYMVYYYGDKTILYENIMKPANNGDLNMYYRLTNKTITLILKNS